VRLRQHIHNLVEGAADEIHELKFRHGAHSGEGSPIGRSHDRGFGNGSINHALRPEAVN
jgi:hypothetical protein